MNKSCCFSLKTYPYYFSCTKANAKTSGQEDFELFAVTNLRFCAFCPKFPTHKSEHLQCHNNVRHSSVSHTSDFSTDALINAITLPYFIAPGGCVSRIYSDNDTNLVGAARFYREAMLAWNQNQIHDYLRQRENQWSLNFQPFPWIDVEPCNLYSSLSTRHRTW